MPFHRRRISFKGLLTALALSTLAFPLALAILIRLMFTGGITDQVIFRLSIVSQELRKALVVGADGEAEVWSGYHPPSGFNLVLTDPSAVVKYSSLADLPVGARLQESDRSRLEAELRAPGPGGRAKVGFQTSSDLLGPSGAVTGRYFAFVFAEDARALERQDGLWPLLAGLCLFSLFGIFASAGVATYIASSVLRLEKAALRIATGDLEGPLQASGLREIASLATAMDDMRVALREAKDSRNRFLASVSHDLRTPLTSLSGYLEAIEDGLADDPATLARYLAILGTKTQVLEERIDGLLEFARMETAQWRLGFLPLELGPFLLGVAREFAEDARLDGKVFTWDLAATEGLRVAADPSLLRRALENLLLNALRYVPQGAPIHLGSEARSTGLYLVVDDAGPGLAPGEEGRIFEPFYRGSASRGGDEGRGLGLYIAQTVIQGHGWTLEAGPGPLGGARFSVGIPASALEGR